jgi:hypothetical protein
MNLCPAAITAGAIFTALVVKDIYEQNYKDIPLRLVGGIFSVLGLAALCKYVGDTAGWILLLIPFFVLIVGFYIVWVEGTADPKPPVAQMDCCGICSQCPCKCGGSWPTDCDGVPLPPPPPVVPPTPKPVEPIEPPTNTFGCPRKA